MIHQKCPTHSLEAEEGRARWEKAENNRRRVVTREEEEEEEWRTLDSPGQRRNLPLIIISTPFPPIDSNLEKHLEDGWLELVIHRGRVRQREAGNKNFRRWLIIN